MIEYAGPDTGFVDCISLTCPNCHPIMTFNPLFQQCIVEHISTHILHDRLVDRPSEPCGLCLQPVPLCKIVLKKAKGQIGNLSINIEARSCPNLVKLSIKIAADCSKKSPCTNHPVVCPYCNDLVLRSWALPPIFRYFPPFYSTLSVTHSPLVPSRAARTATKSPDKSPDGSPDYSAVRYHMPSLRSPQYSAVSLFNPLWIASSLPCHDGPPAHDGAILRTASS